ncbi:hypothetical protein L1987_78023 [Smallanthus sonchifolius]|uniref:Uncharacterized protein n=1 Tax=Smallanthus sonchifolius TaxID=185202 RepID=A0ACB8ZFZ4_9ASTR|nr:hypothetical protein L1987_78023 [Smallanthus sonchifolius]
MTNIILVYTGGGGDAEAAAQIASVDIPWVRAIMLFERIDLDKDKCLSESELKRLIMEVDSEKIQWNEDDATDQMMQV